MAITLQTGIRSISGIGESRARALARLNIFTVEDLLYHFPRAYEYRGNVKTLISAQDGEIASFILTVASVPTVARGKNNVTYMKFLTYDDTAKCTVTIFNQNYLKSTYKTGQTYRAYGKIVKFGRQFEMVNPTLELITSDNELLPLFPVYPATEDMSGKQIFHLTETVFRYIEENGKEQIVEENLPADTVESEKLLSRYEAIHRLHRPEGFSSLNDAKRRMMYEELYFFACDMYKRKQQSKIGTAPDISGCDMSDFKNALTFELTDAQRRTLNEIYSDMTSPKHLPMQRLVSGDVAVLALSMLAGCGKTTGSVTTDGSTSMEKVIGALGEAFQNDTGISFTYNPTGSGSGIKAVQEGRCDIGLSSRHLKAEELEAGLSGNILAYDGIAIIVNPENPVSDLSLETIAKIYTGEITNWSEVGGNDAEIVLIGREAGSGTRDGFESITDTEDACQYRQELTSTGDVITTVAQNPGAIGYASVASVKDTVKALTVDGVAPTEATIKDGSYVVQRPFVLVTKTGVELSDAAFKFFTYITSTDANEIISAAGVVPAN